MSGDFSTNIVSVDTWPTDALSTHDPQNVGVDFSGDEF